MHREEQIGREAAIQLLGTAEELSAALPLTLPAGWAG